MVRFKLNKLKKLKCKSITKKTKSKIKKSPLMEFKWKRKPKSLKDLSDFCLVKID